MSFIDVHVLIQKMVHAHTCIIYFPPILLLEVELTCDCLGFINSVALNKLSPIKILHIFYFSTKMICIM